MVLKISFGINVFFNFVFFLKSKNKNFLNFLSVINIKINIIKINNNSKIKM